MTLRETGERLAGQVPTTAAPGSDASAAHEVVTRTEKELVDAVREADQAGTPVRVVGTATNGAHDFDGQVVRVATQGLQVNDDGCSSDSLAYCGGVLVTVAAGQDWDGFVATAVGKDWVGVECLSGIPGLVGGVTVHNVAAFGQRVADTVASVRTWDRETSTHRRFAMIDCDFGACGESRFSREKMPDGSGRYVVLEVAFLFRQGDLTSPIQDEDLARIVGVQIRDRAPLQDIRTAVLAAVTTRP